MAIVCRFFRAALYVSFAIVCKACPFLCFVQGILCGHHLIYLTLCPLMIPQMRSLLSTLIIAHGDQIKLHVNLNLPKKKSQRLVSLFGCTSAPHAQREGNYIVADNCYRRKIVTFRTELDGMIPTYGDLSCHPCDMLFYT